MTDTAGSKFEKPDDPVSNTKNENKFWKLFQVLKKFWVSWQFLDCRLMFSTQCSFYYNKQIWNKKCRKSMFLEKLKIICHEQSDKKTGKNWFW